MIRLFFGFIIILIHAIELSADIVTFRSGKVVENVKTTILKDSITIQFEDGKKESRPKGEIKSLKVRPVIWRLAEEKKRKQSAEMEAKLAEEKRKAEEEEKARVAEASEKGSDFELRAEEDKISPIGNAALGLIPIYSGAYRTGKTKTAVAMSILEGLALFNAIDLAIAKKKHSISNTEIMALMSLSQTGFSLSGFGIGYAAVFIGANQSNSYQGGLTGRQLVKQIGNRTENLEKISFVQKSTYGILAATLIIDSLISGFSASEWNEGIWTGDTGNRPSTKGARGVRSAFFPGWGQLYGGNTAKGSVFLTTGILLISSVIGLDTVVRTEQEHYTSDQGNIALVGFRFYIPETTFWALAFQHSRSMHEKVEEAVRNRDQAFGVLMGFWIYNIFDAVFFSGKSQTSSFHIKPEIGIAKTNSQYPGAMENKMGLSLEYVF